MWIGTVHEESGFCSADQLGLDDIFVYIEYRPLWNLQISEVNKFILWYRIVFISFQVVLSIMIFDQS